MPEDAEVAWGANGGTWSVADADRDPGQEEPKGNDNHATDEAPDASPNGEPQTPA